jgi:hypothetical protein
MVLESKISSQRGQIADNSILGKGEISFNMRSKGSGQDSILGPNNKQFNFMENMNKRYGLQKVVDEHNL